MNANIDYAVISSPEYKAYMMALCHLASDYVARIRQQFASKAYEMYQDETVRKLVLAYGDEYMKLQSSRLFDFEMAARNPHDDSYLEDTCLNNAGHYAATIKFLFGIN